MDKRYQERRLSRRGVLTGAALGSAGLAAAVMVGCAPREKAQPAAIPGAAQPKRGGTIVRHGGPTAAQDTEGRSFDAHAEVPRMAITTRLVYQALLGYNLRTYEVETDAALAWEQPSPTEYSFKLHPGIRFHNKPPANGREVVAEDVVFSLNRVRTPEPRFQNRSIIAVVDKIEAVDKATVKITTKRPDASALSAFAADPMVIMAPEVVERASKFATPEEVVGTGAFVLKDIQVSVAGEYIRNPDYFQPELPYLDAVRTQYFANDQTAYSAFLAGRVHIVASIPGPQVKEYSARQGPGFTPQWFEHDAVRIATPHLEKRPFTDARVVRALRLLHDHHEFITNYAENQTGSGRHGSIFAAALSFWDVPQEEYTRHIFWRQPKDEAIKEALALLSAAGFSRDTPLKFELSTLDSPTIAPGAELLHAQFRRLGQGVVQPSDLKLYDLPTWGTIRAEGRFEYGFQGLAAAIVEPGVWLNQIWRTGASRNYWRFSDPKVDTLIDKQDVTFDNQQRKAIIREIILYLMDHGPAATGTNLLSLNAVSPKVQGFAPEWFMNGRQYQWLWLEA